MNNITYNAVKRIRLTFVFLCLVLGVCASIKLYYDYMKIQYFKKGQECYTAGNIVPAESWFVKAKGLGLFHYNEPVLSERLTELGYVTEMKSFMAELSENLKEANKSDSVEDLINEHDIYIKRYDDESNKGNKAVFEEISTNYKIEANMEDYFENARDTLKSLADWNLDHRDFTNENFKSIYYKIPTVYYGGEDKKKQEIDVLIRDYDGRKIDIIRNERGISQTLSAASSIISFNKEYTSDCGWVIEKMESIWNDAVNSDMSRSDYDGLYKHYREYEQFIKQYLPKSKALGAVDEKIKSDYNTAGKYVSEGEYSKAIRLYENIGQFRDTVKEIYGTQLKWIVSDPLVSLNPAFPNRNFMYAQSGTSLWDHPVYSLACDDSGYVYLARVTEDCKYNSTYVRAFDMLEEIKSLKVMSEINYNGPVIVVEGTSAVRKAAYVGYAVEGNGLKEIFRFEADGFTVESNEKLLVDNPIGEGEGYQAYYTLADGYYNFSSIKRDYAEVTFSEINEHKGEKIGFSCRIIDYGGTWNRAIATDETSYVMLQDLEYMQFMDAYVIGMYVGEIELIGYGGARTIPVVTVLEVEYR